MIQMFKVIAIRRASQWAVNMINVRIVLRNCGPATSRRASPKGERAARSQQKGRPKADLCWFVKKKGRIVCNRAKSTLGHFLLQPES